MSVNKTYDRTWINCHLHKSFKYYEFDYWKRKYIL